MGLYVCMLYVVNMLVCCMLLYISGMCIIILLFPISISYLLLKIHYIKNMKWCPYIRCACTQVYSAVKFSVDPLYMYLAQLNIGHWSA